MPPWSTFTLKSVHVTNLRLHFGDDDDLPDAYSVPQAIDLEYFVCHSVLTLLKLCFVLSTRPAIRYAEMRMGYTLVSAPWQWPKPG